MKLGKLGLIIMAFLGCSMIVESQNEGFEPSGKAIIRVFSNYNVSFTEGASKNEFVLDRSYLGYEYNFSENWYGSVVFDVGPSNDGGSFDMTGFVKNAFASYEKDGWNVSFGLIGTTSFDEAESAWGYRYLEKSFQDYNKFGSSADLGISVLHTFNDVFSADVILVNGEGYKKIEQDSILEAGVGITAALKNGLSLRVYYDSSTGETDELKRKSTTAFFLNYEIEKFSIGGEYVMQSNAKKVEGQDMDGFTVFATYHFKKIKIFSRLDQLKSKNNWNSLDGKRFFLGAECNPVRGIKIAPNYRHFSPAAADASDEDYAFVNFEIRF